MERLSSVLAVALLLGAGAASAGVVAGKVVVRKDGAPKEDRSQVVVYLEGAAPAKRKVAQEHAIIQKDRQFHPRLTVVQKGDVVAFPNQDLIIHNVFSRSAPAEFDLGEYKSGASRSVRFRKVGTVDIYCNRHPWMVAHVKVLETPYFSVTGPDGTWRIEGVPPGRYWLVAWRPNAPEVRARISVGEAGEVSTPTLVLTEQVPPQHLNKYGAPYDEYR